VSGVIRTGGGGGRRPGGRRARPPRGEAAGRRSPFRVRHPAQALAVGFAGAIAVGTLLLSLPAATPGPGGAPPLHAVFTATSAVCVTGLVIVDTATYWSGFGKGVILLLIQLGGLGIMTAGAILGLAMTRRIGLRRRLTTAAEIRSLGIGDVRAFLGRIVRISFAVEGATWLLLAARLHLGYGRSLPAAAWEGLFHAVSAFNNAGFSVYSDNLVAFVADPAVLLPVAVAVILGGLGFPVLLEVRRDGLRARSWSLHTRLTVWTTAALLVGGTVFLAAVEWNNPATFGTLDRPGRMLSAFFQAVQPRTAGFNSVDLGALRPESLLAMDVLMFIGGGAGGTAGGIKVTTFAVLLAVMVAEVRGDTEVNVFRRRIPAALQRQALTIALAAVVVVIIPVTYLLAVTSFGLDELLFEVMSALSTVGLSTGITAALPLSGQALLIVLMFAGRLGPLTLATALALRERQRLYVYPEEQPIIG